VGQTYSEVAGAHIRVDAIRELLPIFRKKCGHRSLKLGALLLGLGEITTKREVVFRSSSGNRRVATEYFVPALAE
jgi:hypothetical protein